MGSLGVDGTSSAAGGKSLGGANNKRRGKEDQGITMGADDSNVEVDDSEETDDDELDFDGFDDDVIDFDGKEDEGSDGGRGSNFPFRPRRGRRDPSIRGMASSPTAVAG